MTADPWALLAEIHELQPWLSQDADLAARVEAALAGRAEGSTEDVVEAEPVDWGTPDRFQIAHIGSFVAEVFPDRDGTGWVWAIAQRDNANTEAEARRAATAAARGMK
jgi:hypothetical protein